MPQIRNVSIPSGWSKTDRGDHIEINATSGDAVRIGDNGVLENVLINLNGNSPSIVTYGSSGAGGWTIRNLGINGESGGNSPGSLFGVADTGGGSVFENVYMGDGGNHSRDTGIWAHRDADAGMTYHKGHIDFRNVYVGGFSDNGMYCSAPGAHNGGSFTVEDCYVTDCGIAAYRFGTPTTLRNCHADNLHHRGLWSWYGATMEVRDSQIDARDGNYCAVAGESMAAYIDLYDTQLESSSGMPSRYAEPSGGSVREVSGVGYSPNPSVPSGCPTSAMEAATGSGGGNGGGGTDPVTGPSCVRDIIN